MQKTQLHFCSDQTAWKHIIPDLLELEVFQFDWESCQTPQDYRPAAVLLKSSFFCPTARDAAGAIGCWFEQYGLENLIAKIDLIAWGEMDLEIPSRPLVNLPPVINGYILDIQSRHPETPFRSLLKSRGLLHPVERKKLHTYLMACADRLQLEIDPLPEAPAFGFNREASYE
jgi:hypothetical protein